MDKGKLTYKQWQFLEDLIKTFWQMIPIMTDRAVDEYRDVLRAWTVYLCVLAAEVFESQMALVKVGNIRTAYMLLRPLLEYRTRLAFYILQGMPLIKAWESGKIASVEALKLQFWAASDLELADSRLCNILLTRLDDLSPEMMKKAQDCAAKYDKNQRNKIAQFKYMLDEIPNLIKRYENNLRKDPNQIVMRRLDESILQNSDENRQVLRTFSLGTQDIASAFLHGLPEFISDVIREVGEGQGTAMYFESPGIQEKNLMSESVNYLIEMMDSIEIMCGWCFGLAANTPSSLLRKAIIAFQD